MVDGLPSGGWHEPSDPAFGPDGLLYFGNGTVSQNGVCLPQGLHGGPRQAPGGVRRAGPGRHAHRQQRLEPQPDHAVPLPGRDRPVQAVRHKAEKGEVIKGQLKCSGGVWRCHPDGSGLELLAWGIRNPYGLAFSEDGELYVTDNDFEEKGERSIPDDPDRIWHIRNARAPHGSVTTPDWYGFPDLCGDGLPVWHESRRPTKGKAAEPLIEDPPPWAGPAAYLEDPHTCECHMEFCRSDAFGHRGSLFLAQFGTYAPLEHAGPGRPRPGLPDQADRPGVGDRRALPAQPGARARVLPPRLGRAGAAGRLQVPPGRPEPVRPRLRGHQGRPDPRRRLRPDRRPVAGHQGLTGGTHMAAGTATEPILLELDEETW